MSIDIHIFKILFITYKKTELYMTQVILYDNKTVHIDGYKSIIIFDSQKLSLKCKDRILVINGKNLLIDSFSGVCMVVSGIIENVSWVY